METKVCTRCGKSKLLSEFYTDKRVRSGKCSICKSCANKKSLEYARTHKEQRRLTNKKYNDTHVEQKRKLSEAYKEQARQNVKLWIRENQSRKKEMDRHYREKNLLKIKNRYRKYYEENIENYRSYRIIHREHRKILQTQRRAREMGAGGNGLSSEQWGVIKRDYNYRCAYCGQKKELTIDHIVPLIKGGLHDKANVAPACKSCNSSKRDKSLILFMYYRSVVSP